jgi:dephospho-CoA kinase
VWKPKPGRLGFLSDCEQAQFSGEVGVVVIGLTGGIASGKTAASGMLSDLGAAVIDADSMGHQAFRPDTEAWRLVVEEFGREILGHDGEIDRGRLADIVFNDSKRLERLNAIMHPRIREMVEQRIDALRGEGVEVVVVEAALLIEAGWTDLVDQVWVVGASERHVIDRLRAQKGFTEEQAMARIGAQMTASQRSGYADVTIENSSDLDSLRRRVEDLWRELRSSSGA